MAYYLVRAEPHWHRFKELEERLMSGEVKAMEPFGRALHHSLKNARLVSERQAVWEEEDYCQPPLQQERTALLDDYFSGIQVQEVAQGEGWGQIEDLASMWNSKEIS